MRNRRSLAVVPILACLCWACAGNPGSPSIHGITDLGARDFPTSDPALSDGTAEALDTVEPEPCQTDKDCDDGDSCTADSCNPQSKVCVHIRKSCSDGKDCTLDLCDPDSGTCLHAALPDCPCEKDGDCDDGDACSQESCSKGFCAVLYINCNDGDPCTDDSCLDGTCAHEENSALCNDGSICTQAPDRCKAGKCVGGPFIACDDGRACTADFCRPDQGCVHMPVSHCPCKFDSECDDSNACTDDACVAGFCVRTTRICYDGNPCTDDACSQETGGCVFSFNESDCDDGDPCTTGEHCVSGSCKDGTKTGCKVAGKCLSGECDPARGCVYIPIPGCICGSASDCDDGLPCTDDACVGGTCANSKKSCSDGNPCTDDACDPTSGACLHLPNQAVCDDGNLCTLGDRCEGGTCTHDGTVVVDDGLPCTIDGCLSSTGPFHVPDPACACSVDAQCNDGSLCTADRCIGGLCRHEATDCNDANLCTDDSCDPTTGGCVHAQNNAPCDDGNACTTPDRCAAGKCFGGASLACDDGLNCTTDFCDPAVGCVHRAVLACPCLTDADCDDGNLCTADTCSGNRCVYATKDCNDGNKCTDDGCNPVTGACTHTNNTAPCSDGSVCTQNDQCKEGKCAGGPPLPCDDGNKCTFDGCNPTSGCTHAPLSDCNKKCTMDADCDDGDGCTTDKCSAGFCTHVSKVCNDGNRCTDDSCVSATGQCQYVANTQTCDDGDACTTGDACKAGKCVGGAPAACDDGNPCTNDTCDPKLKCVHTVIPGCGAPCSLASQCDDQDPCTMDACDTGICRDVRTSCDDGNPCTDDACDSATGQCTHVPNGIACDDGSACTSGDRCYAGKCASGSLAPVDDFDPCTLDGCDPVSGVFHKVIPNCGKPCGGDKDCADNDLCTDDLCVSGVCRNVPKDCSDSNPCTDDACSPVTGMCVLTMNHAPCDDGDPCTFGDVCAMGLCPSGTPVGCDDGNPCTADACEPTGCTHVVMPGCGKACGSDADCDDQNLCTQDLCLGSTCRNVALSCSDQNLCTDDACDFATGACIHVANAAVCNDGNPCTAEDRCKEGKCLGGTLVTCDDGDVCTNDACQPESGCVHVLMSGCRPCKTNTECVADACTQGSCQGGTCQFWTNPCNDGNPCTDDSCDPVKGCLHTPNAGICDDGSLCTQVDQCKGGKCVGGSPLPCADPDPCTLDRCDPLLGCVHTPIPGCG